MRRWIRESVESELIVEVSNLNGNVIYHDKASPAWLEVIEGIFDIVKVEEKSKQHNCWF